MLAAGLMVAGAMAFSACGDDDSDPDPTATSGTGATSAPSTSTAGTDDFDYSSLGGEIRIDGSSTVFPISEAVAEEFSAVADTRVNVAFSGTGGGIEKFCRGEIEIADASRPIKDEELAACTAAGIDDVYEVRVATDALTVVVNADNTWAECMTLEQLNLAFKTDGAKQWSDIDPAWPAEDIEFFFPGTDSGTFDYFVEEAIEGVDEAATHRGDGTASEDDNVLATGVEGNKNALGYFGFAYFQEAGDQLKSVAIDGGDGCVEPTFDAALDGSYSPLSRPLFIYTRESFLEEKPEVLGFVNFYIENSATLVEEVGYITLPDDILGEQRAKLAPFLP